MNYRVEYIKLQDQIREMVDGYDKIIALDIDFFSKLETIEPPVSYPLWWDRLVRESVVAEASDPELASSIKHIMEIHNNVLYTITRYSEDKEKALSEMRKRLKIKFPEMFSHL